jgi:hypothetical protein
MIVERGYAIATIYYGDIEPDHVDGWKDGLRAAISAAGASTEWKPDDWGAIGAWAFGVSRALDALAQDKAIDATRAAVIGHSRLGKTSLWAGAQDERFSLVISNNSGEGGAALARRDFGETTKIITKAFPHWFCGRYSSYAEPNTAKLPFDAHMLIALAAPRGIHVASAVEDTWADPKGEFLSAREAGVVYELFGKKGVGVANHRKGGLKAYNFAYFFGNTVHPASRLGPYSIIFRKVAADRKLFSGLFCGKTQLFCQIFISQLG